MTEHAVPIFVQYYYRHVGITQAAGVLEESLARQVAIKILGHHVTLDARLIERFQVEARSAGQLLRSWIYANRSRIRAR